MEHVNNIDGEPNTAPRREASEQGDLVDSPPDGDAENERAPKSNDARQKESGEIDITPSAEAPPEEPVPAAALPVRWWELAAYAALLLAAAVSRLWDLGSRAVHHDESLHAYYSWILSNGSGYTHDPMMHGPFQFEATAAVFLVLGDSDYTSRLVYAVAGIALVAMPFLLRRRMGRLGALFASAMLAASPAMLYFSRFSRNDILMAVWTLGLVACAWRYIDEGKNRYLYAAAALLALAFATKETAYIVVAIFGLFLVVRLVLPSLAPMELPTADGRTSTPRALRTLARGVWRAIWQSRASLATREGTLLMLLATLTLPQWAATAGLLQGTRLLRDSGLVLASPVGSPAIGAPTGGGLVIAALLVAALLGVSVYAGVRWRWPVWWRCAAIFYLIWTLLYSTFLTNPGGLLTGVWRSLGYWIVQQDVARGNQPWHYYFVITSLYEFLPLLLALVAGAYFFIRLFMALFGCAKYDIRREAFTWFLLLWSVATFGAYTVAAEKMPWLLVNVTLPLIFVAGKFLGDVVEAINWGWLVRSGAVSLAVGVPLALWLLWQLAFFGVGEGSASGPVALALIVSGAIRAGGSGRILRQAVRMAGVGDVRAAAPGRGAAGADGAHGRAGDLRQRRRAGGNAGVHTNVPRRAPAARRAGARRHRPDHRHRHHQRVQLAVGVVPERPREGELRRVRAGTGGRAGQAARRGGAPQQQDTRQRHPRVRRLPGGAARPPSLVVPRDDLPRTDARQDHRLARGQGGVAQGDGLLYAQGRRARPIGQRGLLFVRGPRSAHRVQSGAVANPC